MKILSGNNPYNMIIKSNIFNTKIINNQNFNFRYACIAFTVLLYFYPDFLFSQNTAVASGNWNDCNSWGNPQAIFRNTTDTKTINSGITITANENWSTAVLRLNGNSAVNMNGGIVLDFVTDQGADKFCQCGAFIAPGVWKIFMCHNLGADYNSDPHAVTAAVHGAKYQWGRIAPAVTQAQDQAGTNIPLSSSAAPAGSWSDSGKTGNDPCPAGYRVPTYQEWQGVFNNNAQTLYGNTFAPLQYWPAVRFGNQLTLPAAGSREPNGYLSQLGSAAIYWSTSANGSGYYRALTIASNGNNSNNTAYEPINGIPVRCIAQ